jgi:hypothetical protein
LSLVTTPLTTEIQVWLHILRAVEVVKAWFEETRNRIS